MSTLAKPVTISTFVRQLEDFNIDFYKNCLLKTNQFSTKFILQQVIRDHQQFRQEILTYINELGEEEVDSRYIDNINEDFSKNFVDGKFELESLNFVEATELAVILIEYVLEKYEIVKKVSLSKTSTKSLNDIIQKKQGQLKTIKKEYDKRRYK